MPDDTIGDLARQDLYPDERYMQPPQNAVGGLTPEDWMMAGQQPPAATYDYVPPQSWLQKAGDLARRDVATYQQGGVPAMMGQLAEDSSGEQDLAGGFGGNIKGVEGKLGALADLAPHAPPFYSAVEQAVAGAKQTTAPGQQWAGFLRNQPGVKPEELSTLKLGDLFDQTAVTKQDLLDHIAANKVQLGEVVRGDNTQQQMNLAQEVIKEKAQLQRLGNEWDAALPEARSQITDEMNLRHDRIRELENQSAGLPERNSKFDQYTLPGGENYRETLLTLPTPNDNYIAAVDKLKAKYGDKPLGQMPMTDAERAYIDNQINAYGDTGGAFKSSHFDEPNILAHIRTNDRVIDGKKTLFVEEVQSDWHQKGKRSGYDVPDQGALTDLPEGYRVSENSALRGELPTYSIYGPDGEQIIGNRPNRQSAINEVVNELNSQRRSERGLSGSPVPDAPFKTTWPDLAMKRVIREAAEGGYDKVAWTPGSVQADRYDLSKQISKVSYVNNYLNAWDHSGNKVMSRADIKPNDLPDYIGKEAAQKLLDQAPKDYSRMSHVRRGDLSVTQSDYQYHVANPDGREVAIGKGTVGSEGEALDYAERYLNKSADEINQKRQLAHDNLGPTRELSGLDLKVGGEGMKGFYDQILPAAVNRIVKKAGGRVQQEAIPIRRAGLKKSNAEILEQVGMTEDEWNGLTTGQRADLLTKSNNAQPVHSIDITPQLREMALKKGFPLFTAGGVVAGGAMGDLAKQDEYQ